MRKKKSAIFNENFDFRERCKGVHCVDLGERFPTSIFLQKLASIQPRTSPVKFACSPRTVPPGSSLRSRHPSHIARIIVIEADWMKQSSRLVQTLGFGTGYANTVSSFKIKGTRLRRSVRQRQDMQVTTLKSSTGTKARKSRRCCGPSSEAARFQWDPLVQRFLQ